MAVKASKKSASNNIVRELPVLPYPLLVGSISFTDNMDSNLTGDIVYQSLSEADFEAVKQIYQVPDVSPKVNLYGISFNPVRFSYTRTLCDVDGIEIDTFEVTVSIEGAVKEPDSATKDQADMFGFTSYADGGIYRPLVYSLDSTSQKGILDRISRLNSLSQNMLLNLSALPASNPNRAAQQSAANALNAQVSLLKSVLNSKPQGVGYSFGRKEILTDGANEVDLDALGYRNSELTFGDGGDQPTENSAHPVTLFKLKEPKIETIPESSKDYLLPPENTIVLRDSTVENFDESGEKKIFKLTTRINGESAIEECYTYGFAYLYEDIHAGNGILWHSEPAKFWRVVEYRKTTYIYQRGSAFSFSVSIMDNLGRRIKSVIHPDYTYLGSISGTGSGLILHSNAEYLTEVVTVGWKLARLKKEEQSRNTLDPQDPYYTAFQFQELPYYSRSVNILDSVRTPGDNTSNPFTVDFQDYETLEPRIKQLFSRGDATEDGKVGIITPDPNYVEPLYIRQELSGSSSFAWMDDPEAEADPDKKIQGTDIPAPPKRLITGEESHNETERTVINATRYSERVNEYSSQDPGFDNSAEHISFKEVLGSAPTAQHRILEYEKEEYKRDTITGQLNEQFKYLISTSNSAQIQLSAGTSSSESLSFPQASSPEEAQLAAEVKLRKSYMSNYRAQKTIFGFHPYLRAGDIISTEGDRFASLGVWRATSIQHKTEYKGIVEGFGLLVTSPGVSLTLGLDPVISSTIQKVQDPAKQGDRSSQPKVEVSVSGSGAPTDTVLPVLPGRRNY